MIQLHYLEKSRAVRILWLLEALGLNYELIHYARQPTLEAPESLKSVHPLGKSPVIVDGDVVVAESGAIIDYLIETYDTSGQFKPKAGQALLDYRFWMHFAEGSMMPWLLLRLVLRTGTDKVPFLIRPLIRAFTGKLDALVISPRLKTQIDYIETWLGTHRWFTGNEISGADFQMAFVLVILASREDLSHYPNIKAYLSRVTEMDSYRRALEKEASALSELTSL